MTTKEFYNEWAIDALKDKKRKKILQWKAANLLNLIFRNSNVPCKSICEIGGADGIVLHTISSQLEPESIVNYEISKVFCELGENLYPDITFRNYDFLDQPEKHDLVILSDITEHVIDDHAFLKKISEYCQYLVIKIPIEKCLLTSRFVRFIKFKKTPDHFQYGPNHINGHLRGYTVKQAKKYISKYYKILDVELSEVIFFNSSRNKRIIRSLVGKNLYIRIYGGALFAIAKRHVQ